MCRYTQPSSSSYRLRFVSEKLFFYLPPSALLSLLRVFAKKGGGGGKVVVGGEEKRKKEEKKKNVSSEEFTYLPITWVEITRERKRAIIRAHSHGFHGN